MTTSPSIAATAAAEVRAEMGRQKVTNRALSASTGIPASTLRRHINEDNTQLTVEDLQVIATALKVPMLKLLDPGLGVQP